MSTTLDIEKIVCPQCYAMLDVGDNYCRHCGASTVNSAGPGEMPARLAPDRSRDRCGWSENRWLVLAMLFLVLGPLGLPMLWRSRQFSLTWKLILTSIMLAVTVAVVGTIWFVMQQALAPLRELKVS